MALLAEKSFNYLVTSVKSPAALGYKCWGEFASLLLASISQLSRFHRPLEAPPSPPWQAALGSPSLDRCSSNL